MRKEKLVWTYKYMIIKILFLFEILKFKNIFKKITMVEKKNSSRKLIVLYTCLPSFLRRFSASSYLPPPARRSQLPPLSGRLLRTLSAAGVSNC